MEATLFSMETTLSSMETRASSMEDGTSSRMTELYFWISGRAVVAGRGA